MRNGGRPSGKEDRIPHPLMSVSTILLAVLFGVFDPFTWWRTIAVIFLFSIGVYGLYQWWSFRREQTRESA
ncbi:hypothetical protein FYJ28_15850 [Arthrobacter sp. BL-252-APC-1A]|uniref:hypothetical protein n=1 Tax=Arthrobacter sp. BL-252-APC-1A TaxID=2606622 RepID=UPI0012B3A767|nr:hypothetical protein [Arthrobacter sp. BL-252-APC-1A]MSS00282.1 hypothetical protein [Arthrobacter sp. BL-252-APC-1A]